MMGEEEEEERSPRRYRRRSSSRSPSDDDERRRRRRRRRRRGYDSADSAELSGSFSDDGEDERRRRRRRGRDDDDGEEEAAPSPPFFGNGRGKDGKEDDDDDNDNDKNEKKKKKQVKLFGVDANGKDLNAYPERENLPELPKEKPTFELSSLLRQEANANERGKFIDYDEPEDKCSPQDYGLRLRLYTFKGDEEIEKPISLAHKSRYIFGRDRDAVDIPTDHPSCSKQHAVLQFRNQRKTDVYGETRNDVAGYLYDNGSTNKTKLNGKVIEAKRYYRLKGSDCVQFGSSTREYVVMDESLVEKKK
jgi:smad nuclear-interacting protein 1